MLKPVLIVAGTLSLGLGIIGIAVPGLPTTPFILLSAGLYLRSSEKLYNWLLSTKWIGSYLTKYQTNKGLTKKGKLTAISIMWSMITVSCLFLISSQPVKAGVFIIGIIGTIVMGYIVPTLPGSKGKEP